MTCIATPEIEKRSTTARTRLSSAAELHSLDLSPHPTNDGRTQPLQPLLHQHNSLCPPSIARTVCRPHHIRMTTWLITMLLVVLRNLLNGRLLVAQVCF